ncbi:hypothetical protein CHUAL_011648, partial [Chamberlinius hualienensis]
GKRIFFVTNNSTRGRTDYVDKCRKLGYEAHLEEMYCTSNTIAKYLKKLNFKKKVYVIGQNGMGEELSLAGIEHTGIGPDLIPFDVRGLLQEGIPETDQIGAVAVGLDKDFNYQKILKASSYLLDPDCLFIASNLDDRFPVENRQIVVPGTGALVSAVKTAAAREPIILGKPFPYMFEAIVDDHKINPERTIMIGDRMDTDILFGTNSGMKTLMVLTGISSLEDVDRCAKSESAEEKKLIPDYYVEQLGDIGKLLQSNFN